MNILFVCHYNVVRSRTAENIYKAHPAHKAKSAGLCENARVRLSGNIIRWSDIIFVMEEYQRDFLLENFTPDLGKRKVITLDICDEYRRMDPELIELIKAGVSPYLSE